MLNKVFSYQIGIRTKLVGGFATMVALASLAALTGVYMSKQFEKDTMAMLEGPIAEINLAKDAWEHVLESETIVKDFALTRNPKNLKDFDALTKNARATLEQIEEQTSSDQWGTEISAAFDAMDNYEQQFHKIYALAEERGFSEQDGLEGKLRTAVHEIEQSIEQAKQDELTVLMLMCRRHEKDYMMRGEREKYLGRIDERISEFRDATTRLNIPEQQREEWFNYFASYRKALHTLADKSDQIDATQIALNQSIEQVRDRLTTIVSTAPQIDTSAIERARTLSMSILGFVIVLGLTLAVWLTRSISAPLNRLTKFAMTLAEGDLRVDPLKVKTNDSIGKLSLAMETMRLSLRDVVEAIKESANDVTTASEHVSASANQTVSGMEHQRRLVEQCSAAVVELSASADEVAGKSKNASDHAAASGESAQQGSAVVEATIDGMRRLPGAVNDGSASVTELGRRSNEIGQVIAVINDIADQTNLLALNAAIEAARAGEHGRGFAVVADEVRKLADRTTQATEEVEQSINAIRKDTSRAVELMQQGTARVESGVEQAASAGNSLQQIKSYALELNDMVSTIAAAAREQSMASADVSHTIQDIANVTNEVSESAQRSSKAMVDLSKRATTLNELANRFRV